MLGGRQGEPQHPARPSLGNPGVCGDEETPELPEGACEALGLSPLQTQTEAHRSAGLSPYPGTTLPISPGGGGGRAWGEGLPQGLLGSVVYWDCPLHAPHSQVGQGKDARRVRPSALRLTSRILKLTGFSVVRSLNGRAAFPPPSSDFPASGSQRVLCVPGSFTLLWANGCVLVSLCSRSLPDTLSCLCVQLPLPSHVHFGPLFVSLLSLGLCCLLSCCGYLLSLYGSLRFPPLSLQPLLSLCMCVCVCFYVQSLSHLHPPSFSKFRRKTSKHLNISIPNLFSSSCGWAEEGARRVPRVAGIWVEVGFRAGLEEPCGDRSRGGGA